MELKEEEGAAAAAVEPAAELSFLERFGGGVRFDQLVAAAQPQSAMQQLAEDLEDRLESLADLAESSASEGEQVTEEVYVRSEQPPLPPAPPPPGALTAAQILETLERDIAAIVGADIAANEQAEGEEEGLLPIPPPPDTLHAAQPEAFFWALVAERRQQLHQLQQQQLQQQQLQQLQQQQHGQPAPAPPWRQAPTGAGQPAPAPAWRPAPTSSSSSQQPAPERVRPKSAPTAFSYGPGPGDRAAERFFGNGHLTSSMIGLSFGIFHSFEFVFPSIKFKLFVDFYFTEAFMPVPARISGDPFKAPKWYTDAGGSQRKWEREHGHQRERGGSILGTLIHDFYCSGSSSVLQVLAVELQSHSMALQFDCFYET